MAQLDSLPLKLEGNDSRSRKVVVAQAFDAIAKCLRVAFSSAVRVTTFALMAGILSANSPQFRVQDLGPGQANFISNDGQVLGEVFEIGPPWLWQAGNRRSVFLDQLICVNRDGYIAGRVFAGYRTNFFSEYYSYYHAAVWFDGTLTDLGTLGGYSSRANSINNSQAVVGIADDASGVPRPYIWRNGVMSSLQSNFPENTEWDIDSRLHITDAGLIYCVTSRRVGPAHVMQLLPRIDGTYQLSDTGILEGSNHSVNAISDLGWAAGEALHDSRQGSVEAFLFKNGRSTWLGNLGIAGSYANGVNNAGDVVGQSNSSGYRAFMWHAGTIHDLNSCIPPNSGWVLVTARSINNYGQIVGMGMLNGDYRSFLLNPIPVTNQMSSITIRRDPALDRSVLMLSNQPTANVSFEVSSDLVHWSAISHTVADFGFLVHGSDSKAGFYRAVFGP